MRELEYQDLLLAIWTDPTPGFYAAVAWDEFGKTTPRAQVHLPFDDPRFMSFVDRQADLQVEELQYVGARLFDALFQGDLLRLYVHMREQTGPTETRLRIRLKIDPLNVARLPWECMYDTRNGRFLGSSPETTLVRFVEQEKEPLSMSVDPPLKLVVAADFTSPAESTRVKPEAGAVRQALDALDNEGVVSVRLAGRGVDEDRLTRERLADVVKRDADVLHLITTSHWSSGEAMIGLVDKHGRGDYLTANDIVDILKDTAPRLVVLSGGAPIRNVGPELARALLPQVPALITLAELRPEDLARRFVDAFYRQLAEMRPVDAALSHARSELGGLFPLESVWLSPALFITQKHATVFQSRTGQGVRHVYQLSEGRYRRSLRETLNRVWPKPERYARQLLRWMPGSEPLSIYLHAADLVGQPQDASELVQRYQRLLLVGEAGSGKSMTLFKLFYDSAQRILAYSAKSPLPVYVPFADKPDGIDLLEFVSQGFDRKLFLSDLEEGRFLFLVDGLDEASAETSSHLTGALNELMERFPLNRFVVTTRRPVPSALDIPDAFEILPFAEWEATDFLTQGESMRVEQGRVVYRQLTENLGPHGGNPQVLAMARRLWKAGRSIPYTRSGLFEAFYAVAGGTLAPTLRERTLPELALRMSRAGKTSIRREHLEGEAQAGEAPQWLAGSHGSSSEELLAALNKTRLLSGPRSFSFPNLAIQEFLTAFAMRSWPSADVLALIPTAEWALGASRDGAPSNLRRGLFHGALPFLSGMLDDSSELIRGLIERDICLASECYREAKSAAAVTSALQTAIQHSLASAGPAHQGIGCLCLESMGDDWAVQSLERLATAPGFGARARALAALGSLCSYRSVPLLRAAAKEDDPNVARAAQNALARIKAS